MQASTNFFAGFGFHHIIIFGFFFFFFFFGFGGFGGGGFII
ncbi:hypothetical protein [Desulfuribacillus stibiiarsenatis]|nr:hypothetical protein [Desulfuribacillus stibiiarsenatis]